jgi:hypothetical protein
MTAVHPTRLMLLPSRRVAFGHEDQFPLPWDEAPLSVSSTDLRQDARQRGKSAESGHRRRPSSLTDNRCWRCLKPTVNANITSTRTHWRRLTNLARQTGRWPTAATRSPFNQDHSRGTRGHSPPACQVPVISERRVAVRLPHLWRQKILSRELSRRKRLNLIIPRALAKPVKFSASRNGSLVSCFMRCRPPGGRSERGSRNG